jgi:hypothetical protein
MIKYKLHANNHAQAWGLDLIIATVIFISAILIFFLFTLNSSSEEKEIFAQMTETAEIISDNLLLDGSPSNWNDTNVIKIGISSNNKINDTKLEKFYNLTNTTIGYSKSQSIFVTKFNYFINFSEPIIIQGNTVVGVGRPYWETSSENVIKTSRFTIYKNKPVTMYVNIWN